MIKNPYMYIKRNFVTVIIFSNKNFFYRLFAETYIFDVNTPLKC